VNKKMEKISLERDDIKVSITKIERVKGMTWMEITKIYIDCLNGLGYQPEVLKDFIEEYEGK